MESPWTGQRMLTGMGNVYPVVVSRIGMSNVQFYVCGNGRIMQGMVGGLLLVGRNVCNLNGNKWNGREWNIWIDE